MNAPWCPRCGDHHDELPLRESSWSGVLWLCCGMLLVVGLVLVGVAA